MIIETRQHQTRHSLLLIPETEAKIVLIESVLGKRIQDDAGLIAAVRGEYWIADCYGPSYLSLTLETYDAQT